MKELVNYMVTELIGEDGKFDIDIKDTEEQYIDINVNVDADHIGKVIGKQGKIARSIRTIVKASSHKDGKKYNVVINER